MSRKSKDFIECNNCDSEFKVIGSTTNQYTTPEFCCYCGYQLDSIEPDTIEEDDEEDNY